ncbi:GNAT family N-acetyltransferase [Neotabrizicola shimadae]|uniref:N-acetyltransferase n=1 Tax=Neotabrizicola shimadae TaxID=2807096 RepID=A0A8G0ZZD9_9RHOB|nr:GNAT family N-acetyltransferase [Neotabrizicola shimadae]QYZ71124.1 N-acetyltransferase [Neotabrizicola shimadae]
MIRPATAADVESVAALWNGLIRDTTVTFTSKEKTLAEVAETIAARQRDGFTFLVAEHGSKVAGFATYAQFRGGDGYARCMEHSIHLEPLARGQGLGRRLMQAIEDHARARGTHSMIAGVSAENAGGLAFHGALGYRTIATVPESGFKFGRWLDLVLMQKILD